MSNHGNSAKWLWLLPPYWVYRAVIKGPIVSSFGPVARQWEDAQHRLQRERISGAAVPGRTPSAAMASALREHQVPEYAISAIYIRLTLTTYIAGVCALLAFGAATYFTVGPGASSTGSLFVAFISLLCSFMATLGMVRHGFNARQLYHMALFDFRHYLKAIDRWLPPWPSSEALRHLRARYLDVLARHPVKEEL